MKFPHPLRLLAAILGCSLVSHLHAQATAAGDRIFAYDRTAPLNLQENGREIRGAALVREVTFTPAGQPVKALLVSPANQPGPHAGILYVHWLGEPATTNRSEFLEEAVTLAGHGTISLLVDAMWAKPKWYGDRIPEEDYGRSIRQVIELRRAMDLLLIQPGIDPKRIAVVGHDFGAMYAMIASAQDQKACTYVFMTAVPRLTDWFLFARQPKDLASYRRQIAPLGPIHYIARLATAPVFFQFASNDKFVSAAQAAEFYATALPRKQMATYESGHDLHLAAATNDRLVWLERELGLAP